LPETGWQNKVASVKCSGKQNVQLVWFLAHKFILIAVCLVLTSCGPDYVKRYDKPLTYSQAIKEKDIDFPLPASSHDIYYGAYADWQASTLVVRFTAPTQDCIKQIETVIAWDDKIYSRTSSYPRVTITNVEPVDAGWLGSVSWFTPNAITNGIYTGTNSSHTPEIWIDLDKGIFYFKSED
jgi:hypothetical protein